MNRGENPNRVGLPASAVRLAEAERRKAAPAACSVFVTRFRLCRRCFGLGLGFARFSFLPHSVRKSLSAGGPPVSLTV